MPDPAWLDALREQLSRQKLPVAYAARLVEELSDHVTDFMEDQMSTDALPSRSLVDRMGAPHDIARSAAQEFARRTFTGRHPILMFVILPIVVMGAGYFASVECVVGVGQLMKLRNPAASSEALSPLAVGAIRLVCIGSLLVPATLTAALFAWLAARAGLRRKWPIITGALVGLVAGLAQMDVYVSPSPGQSRLTLGFGFGIGTAFFQLCEFAVPLLIGLWIFSRVMRQRSTVLAS